MEKRIQIQEDGSVLVMSAQSNEAWAVLNGYSAELYEVEQADDGRYYLAGEVPQPSLEELKSAAKEEADELKTQRLSSSCELEVVGVGSIIYDQQAIINVCSLLTLASDENQLYILADDSQIMATPEQVRAIALAFKNHVEGIYADKISQFAAIDAASTIEELAAL